MAKFGPSLVIVAMSALAAHPAVAARLTVETLAVPARLSLAGGRALVPDLLSVSPALRLAAALPAVLLTLLFYLDQVKGRFIVIVKAFTEPTNPFLYHGPLSYPLPLAAPSPMLRPSRKQPTLTYTLACSRRPSTSTR